MSLTPPDLPDPCPTCGSLTNTTIPGHSPSSRVSELLQCNDPPSESELSDFQNVVESGPGHIADLDKKIARAKEHLTKLINERHVLEANISDARTLCSPIRRIPSHVLRAIARETITSPQDLQCFPLLPTESSDSRTSPWTLTQVSHRWRSTVVNAPELWASMSLTIGHNENPATVAHQMFMTIIRLERAKCFPLTVFVYVHHGVDISNHPLLLIISTRSSLIRKLYIRADPTSYPAFSWLRGRLDQLYILTLRNSILSWIPELSGSSQSDIDAFEYAPQLKIITVDNIRLFRLPNNQITHLDLQISGWQDVENIRQFRNLICLCITYCSNSLIELPRDHTIISLPALTSMTLKYSYRYPKFSFISVPNLRHLELIELENFIPSTSIPIPKSITTLEINSRRLEGPQLEESLSALLESVPNLHKLILSPSCRFVTSEDPLFPLLLRILGRGSLPHLQTLGFRSADFGQLSTPKFVEIVETRRQGYRGNVEQLETVYLSSPLILDSPYDLRWQSLIDGGLKVVYW